MMSVKYYVCSCLKCNSKVLLKQEFMEFEDECCLDQKNLKVLKVFNDEEEAKNYIKPE